MSKESIQIFQKNLKDALSVLKEKTVMDLMKTDIDFQISENERSKAEREYVDLEKLLPIEHRKIVDNYLDVIDKNNADTCDLYYLAGLRDMLRIVKMYDI